jgi:hypothetical protein
MTSYTSGLHNKITTAETMIFSFLVSINCQFGKSNYFKTDRWLIRFSITRQSHSVDKDGTQQNQIWRVLGKCILHTMQRLLRR